MKHAIHTTLLLAGTLLCGCHAGSSTVPPPDGSVFSENFVQIYLMNEAMTLSQHAEQYIRIDFQGDLISNTAPARRSVYDELSLYYDDRTYNGLLLANHNYALAYALYGFDLSCLDDFDERHPRGSSLNDLVELRTVSCREYIRNGYRSPTSGSSFPADFDGLMLNTTPGYSPVTTRLDRLGSDTIVLPDKVCYLYFTEQPTPGEYTFELSLHAGERRLSQQLSMRF